MRSSLLVIAPVEGNVACSAWNAMSHAHPSEGERIELQGGMDRAPALGNVLVATDFSASGRIAIERAASLPFSLGGCLEIVRACDVLVARLPEV